MNLLSQARSVYAGAKRRLLEDWSGSAAGFRSVKKKPKTENLTLQAPAVLSGEMRVA